MRTSQMRKVKATYSEFGTARKSVLINCILAETLWLALYLSEFFTDFCNNRPRKKETDKKKKLLPRIYADLPRWCSGKEPAC